MSICVCGHPHEIHAGGSVCQTMPCGCRGFRFMRTAEPTEGLIALTRPTIGRRPTGRRKVASRRP